MNNFQPKQRPPCGELNEASLIRLYGLFREKMHEVYRKSYAPNPWEDSMSEEYNAWQKYLRTSLALEVRDAEPGDRTEVFKDKNSDCWVRVMNPSNGTSFGHEYIVLPMDVAEKALMLGGLPEDMERGSG
jgi:hypothetical protein